MQKEKPSRTAWAAAAHRASHQVLDGGCIFSDPLALRIIGQEAAAVVRQAEEHGAGRKLRIFIAARTRYAEDALASVVARGVRQFVVLGAGLDTYAYRHSPGGQLRIFEVDHPATQAWKRQCLAAAGISIPPWLTFAPIDFENQTLADGLTAAGFDSLQQTFFSWLGVVPYLTEAAVWSNLGFIASLPNGAHVVFDYCDPPASLPPERRAEHDMRAGRVAELGEAWITFFDSEQLRLKLMALGFAEVEDLGPSRIAARYFPGRELTVPDKGGHILHATTLPNWADECSGRWKP